MRHLCFVEGRGLTGRPSGLEADGHDARCRHLLVEDARGVLLATARLRVFPDGRRIGESYAAATHDLRRLARFPAPMLELGRVCVRPGAAEAAALRAAWGLLTQVTDGEGVGLLFGCASFEGADPARHRAALALLGRDHLGPADWAPGPGTPGTVDLAALRGQPDCLAARRAMPPLLSSYLAMGGWVGRYAVVDRALDTVQVLTVVEISRVPPARARALRALAV